MAAAQKISSLTRNPCLTAQFELLAANRTVLSTLLWNG
jgi:hypothetical protein